MNIFKSLSKTAVLALAGASLAATNTTALGAAEVELGIQTWSLRNMKFDEAVEFAVKHGIKTLQMKDKKVEAALGEDIAVDTHIGQGNADLTGLLAELKKSHWRGVMAIETDSPIFAQNPSEFISQAKKFFEDSSR